MSTALTHGSSTSEITACVEAGCLLVPAQAAAIMEQLAAAESARAALEADRNSHQRLAIRFMMALHAKHKGNDAAANCARCLRVAFGGGLCSAGLDRSAIDALLASSGPQTGDPCAQCGDPIPDAPTGHLCQRCHHDAFKTDLDRSAGEGEAG